MRFSLLDLRHSLRRLVQDRLFSTTAILTLAVGMGAATAVFSVYSAAFLRPLPFPDSAKLVYFEPRWTGGGGHQPDVISALDYLEFRERCRSFRHLAALEGAGTEIVGQYVIKTPAGAAFVASGNVTANFFEALGAKPILGRGFASSDEETNRPRVVILGEKTWRQRFGGDRSALGKTVELDGMPLEIIGVMPASFQFPPAAEIWIPAPVGAFRNLPRRSVRPVQPIGVLEDGVSLAAAQKELDGIAADLAARFPATNSGRGVRARELRDALIGNSRTPITVLLLSTLVLVVIASVNVANLQLARASVRAREFAIRTALGAGRAGLIRYVLLDTMLLAGAGAIAGLGIAGLAMRLFGALAAGGSDLFRATLDWRVLAASGALMLFATLIAGITPAFAACRTSLTGALRSGSSGAGARTLARKWLVAAELALAIMLSVCAGLTMESFRKLAAVDHGIREPGSVSTMLLTFPPASYPTAESRKNVQSEILRRVREIPGVESAGLSYQLPMRGVTFTGLFKPEHAPDAGWSTTDIHWLSPGGLAAFGVPLLRGRWFRDEESAASSHVVIVNQELARRHFSGRDPVGAHLRFQPGWGVADEEIIGVVANIQHRSLDHEIWPAVYKPSLSMQWCYLVVRSARGDRGLKERIAREVTAAASDQPISAMPTAAEIIGESVAEQRDRSRLIIVFGAIEGQTYGWDSKSTYVRNPPYFVGMGKEPKPLTDITRARVLALFGDKITTDHISPAGSIRAASPAGKYLIAHKVKPEDFNQYGTRRGNHEVMMRGAFANIRIKNFMLTDADGVTPEGGNTRFFPGGETMPIYDAAMKYQKEGTPLVVFAGVEYGNGSSRDWAAKGTNLLGVRAVIAQSFERIHRSNLVGMGVLPLTFEDGTSWQTLGLKGDETVTIKGLDALRPRQKMEAEITYADGAVKKVSLNSRILTLDEIEYFNNGGILHYVLRQLAP